MSSAHNNIAVNQDIKLKQVSYSDAKDIFETINTQREYLGQWLPFVTYTKSIEDSVTFIQSIVDSPPERFELVFVINYKDKFAGIIGFKDTDWVNSKTEIGYWLSKPFQGKGIITQSVKCLVEYAFSNLGINRIQIKCAAGNLPSKRVPQRLNFHFEGIERDGELLANGEFTNLEVYSVLRAELESQA
jgi:ribosomal-protein-serine acetyltransferase